MSLQVVLKKLAHDDELNHLDYHLLHHSTSPSLVGMSVSEAIQLYTQLFLEPNQQGNNTTYLSQNLLSSTNFEASGHYLHTSDILVMCPSQRKLNYFEDQQIVQNSLGHDQMTCLYNLMTLLLLNSEPLILQVRILFTRAINTIQYILTFYFADISFQRWMALPNLFRSLWSFRRARVCRTEPR